MLISFYTLSFRPLIGVNFCKRVKLDYGYGITTSGDVSVPLSGLTSVNGKLIPHGIVNDYKKFPSPYRG